MGYTRDYILSLTHRDRERIVERKIKDEIFKQRWDVKIAMLSHTPMTEEGAKALNHEVRELEKDFDRVLRALDGKDKQAKDEPIVSKYTVTYEPGEANSDLFSGLK